MAINHIEIKCPKCECGIIIMVPDSSPTFIDSDTEISFDETNREFVFAQPTGINPSRGCTEADKPQGTVEDDSGGHPIQS